MRRAIGAAVSGDTIQFGVTGTISLANGILFVDKNLTITGPGASSLTINGNNATQVFDIGSATPSTVAIAGLTIQGGNAFGNPGGGIFVTAGSTVTLTNTTITSNTAGEGGGIDNRGTLTLNGVMVLNNSISGDGAKGGGIFSNGTLMVNDSVISGNSATGAVASGGGLMATGQTTIRRTAFLNNSATQGGGVFYSAASGVVTFSAENVTLANNSCPCDGSAIAALGGILNLSSATIANNTAGSGLGAVFSGSSFGGATVNFRNSILASNSGPNAGPPGVGAPRFGDQGFNISSDNSPAWTDPTSQNNTNPLLGPLAPCGPGQALFPQSGSPAVGTGNSGLTVDQCGNPRVAPDTKGAVFVPGGAATSTPTATATPTRTTTSTPTNTATIGPSGTPTNSPTATPTPGVPTSTPTVAPTPTAGPPLAITLLGNKSISRFISSLFATTPGFPIPIFTLDIVVTNSSPFTATGITIRDPLPPGWSLQGGDLKEVPPGMGFTTDTGPSPSFPSSGELVVNGNLMISGAPATCILNRSGPTPVLECGVQSLAPGSSVRITDPGVERYTRSTVGRAHPTLPGLEVSAGLSRVLVVVMSNTPNVATIGADNAATTTASAAVPAGNAANITPDFWKGFAPALPGFQLGTPGAPCAGPGSDCTVAPHGPFPPGILPSAGDISSGTLTPTKSMAFRLTALVSAGVPAGTVPVAVFSTDAGIQAVACAATGPAGTPYTCSGIVAGNVLQGSTVALCFSVAAGCALGTVRGPGAAPAGSGAGVVPLLPPPPPIVLPPLPPPLMPVAPFARPAAEVPVIPEVDSLALLLAGLLGLAAWVGRRRVRP